MPWLPSSNFTCCFVHLISASISSPPLDYVTHSAMLTAQLACVTLPTDERCRWTRIKVATFNEKSVSWNFDNYCLASRCSS